LENDWSGEKKLRGRTTGTRETMNVRFGFYFVENEERGF